MVTRKNSQLIRPGEWLIASINISEIGKQVYLRLSHYFTGLYTSWRTLREELLHRILRDAGVRSQLDYKDVVALRVESSTYGAEQAETAARYSSS